ncbi:hypothetical protein BAE44_0011904 [Dichanthelium oligosanthes]|uniref:3'-5' exonuclease domain-containing protein n=1 Tax=Dichanthelium oligosanthes TaxID=888268 RepID=A0A1E5VPQ2_9POAL|nr:hypothetical protein BAE44_0011904 [Dichanthelium oligosanthes]
MRQLGGNWASTTTPARGERRERERVRSLEVRVMATEIQGYYEDGTTVVSFDEDCIDTTLTDSGDVADSWVAETYRAHRRGHVAGLDVEWRPARARGAAPPVAVLQICVDHRCLVFQILRADHVPGALYGFLADRRFIFVGVGIRDDADKLRAEYGLRVMSMVDLRVLAALRLGSPELHRAGLQALVWEVMGVQMDKPHQVRVSAWDAPALSDDQLMYACADAFASFEPPRRRPGRRVPALFPPPAARNHKAPVAVLQLCVGRRCLVFQILRADYVPDALVGFLADDRITFVGVGVHNDAAKLREGYGLEVARAVDLRRLAVVELGNPALHGAGLQALVWEVMGLQMEKPHHVRVSAWDARRLSKAQLKYACADDLASFEVGRRLYDGDYYGVPEYTVGLRTTRQGSLGAEVKLDMYLRKCCGYFGVEVEKDIGGTLELGCWRKEGWVAQTQTLVARG